MHCAGEIPYVKGRRNKSFCCAACRTAYHVQRNAGKPRKLPPEERPVRTCQNAGCEKILLGRQLYFCSPECHRAATRPQAGESYRFPSGAKYTLEEAERVRSLFFGGQASLRETAAKTGLSLGQVLRIVYWKKKGSDNGETPNKGEASACARHG
jgi:hypothetical protein